MKTERHDITNDYVAAAFREKGLRVTTQRMSVYKFLLQNPIHPSADEIYTALKPENPAFSKTTIYNALNALVESKLAITVKIGENEIRFDGNPDYHGHFICKNCGKIFDFVPQSVEYSGLEGFEITQQDVYFSGECINCKTIN